MPGNSLRCVFRAQRRNDFSAFCCAMTFLARKSLPRDVHLSQMYFPYFRLYAFTSDAAYSQINNCIVECSSIMCDLWLRRTVAARGLLFDFANRALGASPVFFPQEFDVLLDCALFSLNSEWIWPNHQALDEHFKCPVMKSIECFDSANVIIRSYRRSTYLSMRIQIKLGDGELHSLYLPIYWLSTLDSLIYRHPIPRPFNFMAICVRATDSEQTKLS